MYNHNEIQKCDAIIPPSHEVRMNSARMKKQEEYDKLMSNVF